MAAVINLNTLYLFILRYKMKKSLNILLLSFHSVEGDGRPNEGGPSLDGGASYGQGPVTHGSAISPDRFESPLYSHGVQPGPQRPRRPKLQHSQSILRKQAEEEAIKRSRSLSESYELSADLQDKQVFQIGLQQSNNDMGPILAHIYSPRDLFFPRTYSL